MEIAELDAFKAIVDYGSVTQAAARLNRAQSSISFRIKTLESRLGIKLFERSGRSIIMTAQGRDLYVYATQILELVARAKASLGKVKALNHVRLGVIENLTLTRPGLMQKIVSNPQGLDVDISIGHTQSLLNDLESGRLDAVIVGAGFSPARFHRVTLFKDPMVLIYSEKQGLIENLNAFNGQVFLVNSRLSASQRNLDELFLAGEISPARIVECGSYPLLFSNVASDLGVSMVPLSLVDVCTGNQQIRVYPLHGTYASLTSEFVFFDHPGKPAPRELAQIVAEIERNAHEVGTLAIA
jgi:DNA-binding transcriptional LysR family regulator